MAASQPDRSDVGGYESAMDPTVMGPQPHQLIGNRYRVIQEIGRGGMGVVFLAQDPKLNRYVAIKRLILRGRNSEMIKQRFLREAQSIASLAHYHIVNVYDVGQDDGGYFICMEYVAGPALNPDADARQVTPPVSVEQYVRINGPFNHADARKLTLKLCGAVDYAHSKGIIHRDIKPSNVLLDAHFEPKLVDFGLARTTGSREGDGLTQEGIPLGTPEYAAPEQWSDAASVDCRADVYSLAGLYWYMISGEIPRYFRDTTIPEDCREAVIKAFARKADERFDSARAFAEALSGEEGRSRTAGDSAAGESQVPADAGGDGTSTLAYWVCSACQKPNPESARYCVHCGAYGTQSCPVCDAEIRVGTSFCPSCGVDISGAEEAGTTILTAKNHANFLEFQTAIDTVRDLAKEHSEIGQLAKQWRQTVLERRNLLNDMDSALRIYNFDKTVEAAVRLKAMVPLECLSDSADYDISVRYLALLEKLKRQLTDVAKRARDEYNLERFANAVGSLVTVFGKEECEVLAEELQSIRSGLDAAVTQAGLAISVNCLAAAMAHLQSIPPWKGTPLGERRARLHANCAQLVQERERSTDEIEAHLRNDNFSAALNSLLEMMRFCLPARHLEIRPAPEDVEANDRILAVEKSVMTALSEAIPKWLSEDRWGYLAETAAILRQCEASSWKRQLEKLTTVIKKEVTRRYERAVELERRGRLLVAADAWERFQQIPTEFCPGNWRDFAQAFDGRRQAFLSEGRRKLARRLVVLFVVMWIYPGWLGVQFAAREGAELASGLTPCIPALVQFACFAAFAVLAAAQTARRDQGYRHLPMMSSRLLFSQALAVTSPLAMSLVLVLETVLPRYAPTVPVSPGLLLAYAGGLWLLFDLLGGLGWRTPAAYILTVSWGVAAAVGQPTPDAAYNDWARLSLIQLGIFLAFHAGFALVVRARMRRRQKTLQKVSNAARSALDSAVIPPPDSSE